MNIIEAQESVYGKICSGCITSDVLNVLYFDGGMIHKECDLWDYKESFDGSNESYNKLAKHVSAFYNSYGGYIIYGVAEIERDANFKIVGVQKSLISIQKLKSIIIELFGVSVDFLYNDISFCGLNVGMLYIPQRDYTCRPISARKDISANNLLTRDAVYFRTGDQCKQVKSTEDFEFVVGRRKYIQDVSTTVIEHNLPHKNFICKNFVGRVDIISKLWTWLDDDLNYTIILAGEGGRGKTSIAYEFCKLLLSENKSNFEQIIWLTAKVKQFIPTANDYAMVGDTHFNNLESMLIEICRRTGSLDFELEGLSVNDLKRTAKKNLNLVNSLVVIDDVDSNTVDEQRRILETARIISCQNSKIILTTRVNNIYSSDSCTEVPGLFGEDYSELIESLCQSLKLKTYNEKNIAKLQAASNGSPLYTESILRLCRTESLERAIINWNGKSGEAVREAALRKEISELGIEAKKILITLSRFDTCSKTEIAKITGIGNLNIDYALESLSNLFLIEAKRFSENEPRFDVNTTTSLLVKAIGSTFIADYDLFIKEIDDSFQNMFLSSDISRYSPEIAKVVRQCTALLADGNYLEARKTAESLSDKRENISNPDLLYLMAKINNEDPGVDKNIVRRLLDEAKKNGQSKESFFHLYYNIEKSFGERNNCFVLAREALSKFGQNGNDWVIRFLEESIIRSRSKSKDSAFEVLKEAYITSCESIRKMRGKNLSTLKDYSKLIIDEIFKLCREKNDVITLMVFSSMAVNGGDSRSIVFSTLITAVREATDTYKSISHRNRNGEFEYVSKYESVIGDVEKCIKLAIIKLESETNRREVIISDLYKIIEH